MSIIERIYLRIFDVQSFFPCSAFDPFFACFPPLQRFFYDDVDKHLFHMILKTKARESPRCFHWSHLIFV